MPKFHALDAAGVPCTLWGNGSLLRNRMGWSAWAPRTRGW